MKKYLIIVAVAVTFVIAGAGILFYPSVEPITACEPVGGATPLCGWQNPEDMAALPDGRHVIVSEYGGMNGEQAGTLALLDVETGRRTVLYDGGSTAEAGSWGAAGCAETAAGVFSPHGIHLSRRAGGKLQLLAVQHGDRDSVEMFQVVEDGVGWSLRWRGCVIGPEGSLLNDVAGTPDGGFLVTHMFPRREGSPGMMVEAAKVTLFGAETGHVLAWRPGAGFHRLAGSEGAIANGIEISPDGSTAFVNYSMAGEVRVIDVAGGGVKGSLTDLPPLDNASWAPDGRLLVAGGLGDTLDMMACESIEAGACPAAFAIIAVDPVTMESETVFESDPGTPGGAGTVGLAMPDGTLLIGTFAGDRILQIHSP